MLLLQRSVLHTHLMTRPLKRICALQVASGQDFSAISQAATAETSNTIDNYENRITIITLDNHLYLLLIAWYTLQQLTSFSITCIPIIIYREHNMQTSLEVLVQVSYFMVSYHERQPLVGHRWPHNSPHSIRCSRRAAPTRLHCQQLCIFCSGESLGRHTVSSEEKTDWRHINRCILGEKGKDKQLLWMWFN